MDYEVRDKIEELWVKRKHGKVNARLLTYEVFANEPLRKIKVLVNDKYLPMEFYSLEALEENKNKIFSMSDVLKDSRLFSLRQIFVKDSVVHIKDDQSSFVDKQVKYETDFYPFYNKNQQLLVVVVRPSGSIFYQRMTSSDQLVYALANQVGFLEVLKKDNGVYTSPDGLLQFRFVGDRMEIVNDLSK